MAIFAWSVYDIHVSYWSFRVILMPFYGPRGQSNWVLNVS